MKIFSQEGRYHGNEWSVVQCNFDTNYVALVQTSQIKCTVLHKTPLIRHQLKALRYEATCASDQLVTNSVVPNSPSGSVIQQNDSQNSGKHYTQDQCFIIKVMNQEQLKEETLRARSGEGPKGRVSLFSPSGIRVCHHPSTLMCSPTRKLIKSFLLGFSSSMVDWLIGCVTELNLQPHPFLLGGQEVRWLSHGSSSQPSSHMVDHPSMTSLYPVTIQGPTMSHLISINSVMVPITKMLLSLRKFQVSSSLPRTQDQDQRNSLLCYMWVL